MSVLRSSASTLRFAAVPRRIRAGSRDIRSRALLIDRRYVENESSIVHSREDRGDW